MKNKEMTSDELKEAIQTGGVQAGEWQETPERTVVSPMATSQVEALMKLRDILETLIKEDTQRVTGLREQLIRLQFGGGS